MSSGVVHVAESEVEKEWSLVFEAGPNETKRALGIPLVDRREIGRLLDHSVVFKQRQRRATIKVAFRPTPLGAVPKGKAHVDAVGDAKVAVESMFHGEKLGCASQVPLSHPAKKDRKNRVKVKVQGCVQS